MYPSMVLPRDTVPPGHPDGMPRRQSLAGVFAPACRTRSTAAATAPVAAARLLGYLK
jgi:hypothetical protein